MSIIIQIDSLLLLYFYKHVLYIFYTGYYCKATTSTAQATLKIRPWQRNYGQ